MRIVLAAVLGLVALAALFFVVAGIVITVSGVRARRGVKGDIVLTGLFLVCFVLAAGGCALVALPNGTDQIEQRPKGQRQETTSLGQPRAESEAGQPTSARTENDTVARSEPAAPPDPSLALDCKDFTSQEAAQKALDQDLEDRNALDPDTDGAACEALADPDSKPKPDPVKKPEKKPEPDGGSEPEQEPESKDKSASEKKSEPEKESKPEKKPAPRKEPASEKKAESEE